MASYKGQYPATIDEKGRLAIPARFRSSAGKGKAAQFILTRGLEKCLALYPNSEWKKVEKAMAEKMSGIPFSPRDYRFFERYLNANAVDVVPDRQGRILLPSFLLKASGIEKEVLVIGVSKRIELWNPDQYREYVDGYGEPVEQVAERLFSQID